MTENSCDPGGFRITDALERKWYEKPVSIEVIDIDCDGTADLLLRTDEERAVYADELKSEYQSFFDQNNRLNDSLFKPLATARWQYLQELQKGSVKNLPDSKTDSSLWVAAGVFAGIAFPEIVLPMAALAGVGAVAGCGETLCVTAVDCESLEDLNYQGKGEIEIFADLDASFQPLNQELQLCNPEYSGGVLYDPNQKGMYYAVQAENECGAVCWKDNYLVFEPDPDSDGEQKVVPVIKDEYGGCSGIQKIIMDHSGRILIADNRIRLMDQQGHITDMVSVNGSGSRGSGYSEYESNVDLWFGQTERQFQYFSNVYRYETDEENNSILSGIRNSWSAFHTEPGEFRVPHYRGDYHTTLGDFTDGNFELIRTAQINPETYWLMGADVPAGKSYDRMAHNDYHLYHLRKVGETEYTLTGGRKVTKAEVEMASRDDVLDVARAYYGVSKEDFFAEIAGLDPVTSSLLLKVVARGKMNINDLSGWKGGLVSVHPETLEVVEWLSFGN